MAVSKPKPKYRQPKLDYWVKLTQDIWNEGHLLAKRDEVCKVMQYLEEDGRYATMPTVRVQVGKSGTLCGLYKHEFIFCNQQGEPDEKASIAV